MYVFLNFHFHIIALCLLCCSVWQLLLLCLLRWRNERLPAIYVRMQNAAQAKAIQQPERVPNDGEKGLMEAYPKISVVVPVCREVDDLEPLLMSLLGQQYAGWYEIVVANEGVEEQVGLLLERMMKQSSRLRATFVPASSRYIELRKLAITLGVKASRGEWIIIVNPSTKPMSQQWLQSYAEHLTADVDFALGYVNYSRDDRGRGRRAIMERVRVLQSRLRAYEHGVVAGCEQSNFAMRRSWFIANGGFADSLELPFGEEFIMACLHSDASRSVYLCAPDTRLVEKLPSRPTLTARRVAEAECRKRLHGRQRWFWRADAVVAWCPFLFLLSNTVYTALRLFMDCNNGAYSSEWLEFDIVAGLCWIVAMSASLLLPRSSMKALQERHSGLYIWAYDLLLPFRMLCVELLRRAQRRHFVRRYIPVSG